MFSAATVVHAQTLRQLHSFDAATEGTATAAPLMQARDGLFYGVNRTGGPHGRGTLFRMSRDGAVTVLHAFTGGADGASPNGPLVQAFDGHLYGMAAQGGAHSGGVAFRVTVDGTFTALHAFGETAGAGRAPLALIHTATGFLYGTSCAGGADDVGTIFRMNLIGDVTTLYTFTNGGDGRCPYSLLMARDGALYGTAAGGPLAGGIAFRMTAEGELTKIHDYVRTAEGGAPGPLIESRIDGQLYGVTSATRQAFDFHQGSVYRMTKSGDLQVLHTFGNAGPYDGIYPLGALVEGTDGNFYGVTEYGGYPVSYYTATGTLFRMTRDGAHTVLRRFLGEPDGTNPRTGLMQSSDGHLYGSSTGGFSGGGMIFRLETYLCTSTLDASYDAASQFLTLNYRLQSAGPGTWSLWAITPTGAGPLWSVEIGAVPEPMDFNIGHVLPPSGPILFVSHLSVPGFGSCGGVAFIDSGTATVSSTRIR
jgi:uncharacterized repeat protein (TIGR03803 family)